jgi:hypothetical protein
MVTVGAGGTFGPEQPIIMARKIGPERTHARYRTRLAEGDTGRTSAPERVSR